MADLDVTLATVRERVAKHQRPGIGEQDTKAALIVPVLRAVGWDVEDLDEVKLEHRRRPGDDPVDYALFVSRTARLFVGARDPGLAIADLAEHISVGGWPGLRERTPDEALVALRGYLEETRRVDLTRLDGVRRDPEGAARVLRSVTGNTATAASARSIAADVGGSEVRRADRPPHGAGLHRCASRAACPSRVAACCPRGMIGRRLPDEARS